VFKLMTTDSKE